MNKHNSVTSTYYLLLKSKKREYVKDYEKKGKWINKYFEISNEKQELIDILMNFEPSSRKKSSNVSKTNNFKREEKVQKEASKNEVMEEYKRQNK